MKHHIQNSSLLAHLARASLTADNTTFVEFGSGRAALSYWLSVRLNALGSTVAGSTALALYAQSLANEDKLSPPEAGLVLTYAVSFTAAIIGLMRTYTELELSMNAVERIAEYLDLPPEPPLELESAVLC